MTYSEKLKDPRWQKLRLEIFERDDWTCKGCGAKSKTLHVHHEKYSGNPWDAEHAFLHTLCEQCHEDITSALKMIKRINPDGLFRSWPVDYQLQLIHSACERVWNLKDKADGPAEVAMYLAIQLEHAICEKVGAAPDETLH